MLYFRSVCMWCFLIFKQRSPSSSMGEDSFGLVTSADDSSIEAKNAAEAVNPGVILKSTSASEVMMRSKSNESLDDDIGGGLRSSNRTSFKAARQHVKVDCMGDPLSLCNSFRMFCV